VLQDAPRQHHRCECHRAAKLDVVTVVIVPIGEVDLLHIHKRSQVKANLGSDPPWFAYLFEE
jgi:hypothetical protein